MGGDSFVKFQQIYKCYTDLDFNKVIYGGKIKSLGIATLIAIVAVTPAYFVSKSIDSDALKTPVLLAIAIAIAVLSMYYGLRPYTKRKGEELGIETQKEFFPLKYRDYVFKSFLEQLTRRSLTDEKSLQKLIDRAYKYADDQQKNTIIFRWGFLASLFLPFWALTLSWIFKFYIEVAEDPVSKFIDVSKYVLAVLLLVGLINYLISMLQKESMLSKRNKYLSFANLLEDILLSDSCFKTKSDPSLGVK